ncbi:hypothetical protein JHK86_010210 [Glycine max]|nr:hypothetical protein JHK86_010210 [Glycine max]
MNTHPLAEMPVAKRGSIAKPIILSLITSLVAGGKDRMFHLSAPEKDEIKKANPEEKHETEAMRLLEDEQK